MRVYITLSVKDGTGTVFHLRKNCGRTLGLDLVELAQGAMERLRKDGIRRICLACRKSARRSG